MAATYGETRPTAAIPTDSPCCSCKRTRVRSRVLQALDASLTSADYDERVVHKVLPTRPDPLPERIFKQAYQSTCTAFKDVLCVRRCCTASSGSARSARPTSSTTSSTSASSRCECNRTRVSLQLQRGFSIGIAAVSRVQRLCSSVPVVVACALYPPLPCPCAQTADATAGASRCTSSSSCCPTR